MSPVRVAVIGCGAIGSLYAAHLARVPGVEVWAERPGEPRGALRAPAPCYPDGITGTSTGKGPAVALAKLQDRVAGAYSKRLSGPAADESKDSLPGNGNHAPVQDRSH